MSAQEVARQFGATEDLTEDHVIPVSKVSAVAPVEWESGPEVLQVKADT